MKIVLEKQNKKQPLDERIERGGANKQIHSNFKMSHTYTLNSPHHCIVIQMTDGERGANSASEQNNAVVAVQPKKKYND